MNRARVFMFLNDNFISIAINGSDVKEDVSYFPIETWKFESGEIFTLSRVAYSHSWCVNHKPKNSFDGPELFLVQCGQSEFGQSGFWGVYKPTFSSSEKLLAVQANGMSCTMNYKGNVLEKLEYFISKKCGKLLEKKPLCSDSEKPTLLDYILINKS